MFEVKDVDYRLTVVEVPEADRARLLYHDRIFNLRRAFNTKKEAQDYRDWIKPFVAYCHRCRGVSLKGTVHIPEGYYSINGVACPKFVLCMDCMHKLYRQLLDRLFRLGGLK